MRTKLFVGNVPQEMSEEDLTTLFTDAGNVASAKIVLDRYTGQRRGFAFVEMDTKMAAQKAISMFNGRNIQGQTLAVNEAKAPKKGFGGRGGRRGY